MKKTFFTTAAFVLSVLSVCCTSNREDSQESTLKDARYNIALVIDGTDRNSTQNGIPEVSAEEMVSLAYAITEKGSGSLYVTFVDDNCDNNQVAIFDWVMKKPDEPGEKKGYTPMQEYKDMVACYNQQKSVYDSTINNDTASFAAECRKLRTQAYSNKVATTTNGSDVNGVINQSVKLLQTSGTDTRKSYIILVSDGCDNVGKELCKLPPNIEVLMVNTNTAKHQYGDSISKEFANLKQAYKYIFEGA